MKPEESKAPCVPQILQKLSLTKKRAALWVPPKKKPVPQAGSVPARSRDRSDGQNATATRG